MSSSKTSDRTRFQEMLPHGVHLKDPIRERWTGNSDDAQRLWLFHAVDSRAGTAVDRIVRFVRLDGAEWTGRFRERLKTVMSSPMPYVARPLHVGFSDDGSICWLVSDRRAKPLETTTFLHDDGLPEERVLVLLRQMLTALASLHDAGLKHGNVCSANVVLDPAEGRQGEEHPQ